MQATEVAVAPTQKACVLFGDRRLIYRDAPLVDQLGRLHRPRSRLCHIEQHALFFKRFNHFSPHGLRRKVIE